MESKYSSVLSTLKQPPAPDTHPIPDPPPLNTPAGRNRGRPPGKRSDPNYQPTTVLLRKATKRAATRLLEDQERGQDLSELIEELLTDWIHHSIRANI